MSGTKYDWQIGGTLPELEAHSAAKHAVFRSYVRRYIDVLTADPRHDGLNLTLVDGFAGGGLYLADGNVASGSPMILLEEISAAQARFDLTRSKSFNLNAEFIFVESDGGNHLFLNDTVTKSPFNA